MKQTFNQLGTIGILMGGYSSEREISLRSGKAVVEALTQAGCKVKALDIILKEEHRILEFIREAKIDVAFIALHGKLGEDGTIQMILERLKTPYTGSGARASCTALNKVSTQRLFKEKDIPVAEFEVFSSNGASFDREAEELIERMNNFPVVVKPACEGSSIGITVVHEKDDFRVALTNAFRYGNEVLVERFIEGRELTVGILGQQALPVIEILPKNKFFDFKAKYEQGITEYLIPAPLPENIARQVQEVALSAHRVLGCRDVSRVDIMLDRQLRSCVLEVNTIPGFTATSLLPKAARAAGMDFTELCLKLIELAYEKKR